MRALTRFSYSLIMCTRDKTPGDSTTTTHIARLTHDDVFWSLLGGRCSDCAPDISALDDVRHFAAAQPEAGAGNAVQA